MDAPNYVQGLYTVAQRDTIFAKANKYPDAANGLQNQVPTIFPDGSIGWRQIPEGGDGTANANIAVVESTQYASKNYVVGSLLIYNGQLYLVTAAITAGSTITPGANVTPITLETWIDNVADVNDNLLDNGYMANGSTGSFPINQNGHSSYSTAGQITFDRWELVDGSVTLPLSGEPMAGESGGSICQRIEFDRTVDGEVYTLSALTSEGLVVVRGVLDSQADTTNWQFYDQNDAGFFGVRAYGGYWEVRFNFNAYVSFKALKLEKGPVQTLARLKNGSFAVTKIPNYRDELSKCRRYMIVFGTSSNGVAYIGAGFGQNATQYRFMVPTTEQMVRVPKTTVAYSAVNVITEHGSLPVSALNCYWQANFNSVNLLATVESGGVYGENAILSIGNSGSIKLDANIYVT